MPQDAHRLGHVAENDNPCHRSCGFTVVPEMVRHERIAENVIADSRIAANIRWMAGQEVEIKKTDSGRPAVGWILYDGSCGFCRRWVPFWENALRARGFGIAPLQADWVRRNLAVPEDQLLDDLRLLLADGSHLAGAEAYRHAMRRIWWAWPVYLFSVLPGCRWLFDRGYRTFARNRHRVSSACRMG